MNSVSLLNEKVLNIPSMKLFSESKSQTINLAFQIPCSYSIGKLNAKSKFILC